MNVTITYTACCRSTTTRIPTIDVIRFGENAGKEIAGSRLACAACLNPITSRMISIETRNSRKGTKTECGAACLGGKVSCDCRCNGRCHGADKCLCGEVA